MESRDEIEDMRVADLKQFLKLHGQLPTVVTRTDGTPGPPRKADLLRAALAIEEAHRTQNYQPLQQDPTLSPYSPHINPQARRNEFQSRLVTPPKNTPNLETPPPPTTQQPQRNDDNALAARIATPGKVTNRKRRSSGVWIDPMLLRPSVPVTPLDKVKGNDKRKEASRAVNTPSKHTPVKIPQHPPTATEVPIGEAVFPDDDDDDSDYGGERINAIDDSDWDEEIADDDLFDFGVLHEDRRDVLVQSDIEHVPDGRREESEDIEEEGENFDNWETHELRRWLDSFRVRYGRRAGRSELISLAKAHALQLEMEAEMRDNEKMRRTAERKQRRRRVISAPVDGDDESELKDTQRTKVQRKRGRVGSIGKVIMRQWAKVRISWPFVVGCLGLLLGILMIWSLNNIYRNHTKPFCDTGKTTTAVEDGYGCRKCPNLGTCQDGNLTCDEGYVVVGKSCVEDQESSIMAEEIAREVNSFLSTQAGYADCGETDSAMFTESEIRQAVRLTLADRPRGGFFDWSSRAYHADKFDHAFEKALLRLMNEEDFPDVAISEVGVYHSLAPVHSLGCRVKLLVWREWKLFAGLVVLLVAFVSVKIMLYFRRKDQEKLDFAYKQALDLLREQKANFVRSEEEFAFMSDVVLRQEVLGYPTDAVVQLWKRVEVLLKNDNRLAYSANRVVKGVPSNTYEWRSRVSTNRLFASGGSARSVDSSMSSAGRDVGAFGVPGMQRESWLGGVQRRLFNARS